MKFHRYCYAAPITVLVLSFCIPAVAQGSAQDTPVSGPAIAIDETHIDLGIISGDVEEIVVDIFYKNVGTETLHIMDVDGPCSCFNGYTSDESLEPAEIGLIQARFDPSKLPVGKVHRMVRVLSDDRTQEAVEVHIDMTIEREGIEEELRKMNIELANIRKQLTALRNDVKKLSSNSQPTPKKVDTTVYKIDVGDSPTLGRADALVTIVEFTDFECPYCSSEVAKIKQILEEFPDDVRLVFKHYPLRMHANAKAAHATAELARLQGGDELFWKAHDKLFANSKRLTVPHLRTYAGELGLDPKRFDETMDSTEAMDELLKTDITEAKKCNVTGTPSIFINGLKLSSRSIGAYRARVNQILAEN